MKHDEEIKKNEIFIMNADKLYENINENKYLWISIIISIFILSNKNILFDYITFIGVIFVGYLAHLISHYYDFEEIYNQIYRLLKSKDITINERIDRYIRNIIKYTFDFHDKIHHVSEINKNPENILIEIIQNILSQGGIIILLFYRVKIIISTNELRLNTYVIVLWISIYLYIHHVYYNVSSSEEHKIHHKNPKYNLDSVNIFDIIMNTIPPTPKDSQHETLYTKNSASIFILIMTYILYKIKNTNIIQPGFSI